MTFNEKASIDKFRMDCKESYKVINDFLFSVRQRHAVVAKALDFLGVSKILRNITGD